MPSMRLTGTRDTILATFNPHPSLDRTIWVAQLMVTAPSNDYGHGGLRNPDARRKRPGRVSGARFHGVRRDCYPFKATISALNTHDDINEAMNPVARFFKFKRTRLSLSETNRRSLRPGPTVSSYYEATIGRSV